MGKKEKSGKKKGPLRKLSKCLFFWGNKRSGKESKQESSLKRAHSESSVDNTPHAGNVMPASSEQGVDAVNIGECSGSHSHSHIEISWEITELPELANSENVMPTVELQHTNVEASVEDSKKSSKKIIDIHKLDHGNDHNDANANKQKFERFVVTSITEENRNLDGINRINPKKSENTIFPKIEEKCQYKQPISQSKFYTAGGIKDINELCSKAQVSHPNIISDNNTNKNTKNDSKPITPQNNLSVCNNTNGNSNINSEPQICKPSLKSDNGTNFIYQPSDPKLISHTNVADQKSEPQISQSHLTSTNCNGDIDMQYSKVSTDNHANNLDQHHSSHSLVDHTNDLDECNSEPQSLQPNIKPSNHNDIEEEQSESQIFPQPLKSANHTNDIDKEHSVLQVFQSNIDPANYIKSDIEEQHICQLNYLPQHHETQVYQPNSSLISTETDDDLISEEQIDLQVEDLDSDSANSVEDIPQTEMQYDLNKNQGFTDSEVKHLDNLEVETTSVKDSGEPGNSFSISTTLSSVNHGNSDHENLSKSNKSVASTDSCLVSNNFKIDDTPLEGPGNHNKSSVNSTQGSGTKKGSETSFHVAEQNDNPPPITKPDGGCLKNNNQGGVVENYPSINIINGTSDIGMTLVVLPYLTPNRENENWKVLSDLTTNGNYQKTVISKSSEMLYSQETQTSTPKSEVSKKEGNKSVQRNNALASAAKHSRLPVRRSVESDDIVDKISKLSTEIEEINTNIKQKPIYTKQRSHPANKSKSKIPRKCANDSLSPK